MNEKRQQLIEMSKGVKTLISEGAYETVNEALIEMYRKTNPNITDFKTLHDWNKAGKRIRKGSKAYLIWARPKNITKHQAQTEEEKMKYFPMCFLFSNEQVE